MMLMLLLIFLASQLEVVELLLLGVTVELVDTFPLNDTLRDHMDVILLTVRWCHVDLLLAWVIVIQPGFSSPWGQYPSK